MRSTAVDVVHDQATRSEPDRLIPVGYLRARRQCIRAWKHVGAEVAGLAMLALAARVAGIETLSVVAAVAAAIVAWRGWSAAALALLASTPLRPLVQSKAAQIWAR